METGLRMAVAINGEKVIGHQPGKKIMCPVIGLLREMDGTGNVDVGVEKITHK
jgi:hypothetical protein